jgi:hypothetical protein
VRLEPARKDGPTFTVRAAWSVGAELRERQAIVLGILVPREYTDECRWSDTQPGRRTSMSTTLYASYRPPQAGGAARVLRLAPLAVVPALILVVSGCGTSGGGTDGVADTADGRMDAVEGAADAADVDDAGDAADDEESAGACPVLVEEFPAIEVAHGYNDAARPAPGTAGWVVPFLDVSSVDAALRVMPLARDAPATGPMTTVAEGTRGALAWHAPGLVWTGEESVGVFQSASYGHPVAEIIRLVGAGAAPTGDAVALDDTSIPTGSAVAVWSGDALAVVYAAWTDGTSRAELRFRRFDRNLGPLSSPRTARSDAGLTLEPRDLAFGSADGLVLWTEWPVFGTAFVLAWAAIAPDGTLRGAPQSVDCGAARPGCGSVVWTGREYAVLFCCIDDATGTVDSYVEYVSAGGSAITPAALLLPGQTVGVSVWDGSALVLAATETFPDLHVRLAIRRYHPGTESLDAPLWEIEGADLLHHGMAFADDRLFVLWVEGAVGDWSVMARGWRCAPAGREGTP